MAIMNKIHKKNKEAFEARLMQLKHELKNEFVRTMNQF
jgi:hypothetical protein